MPRLAILILLSACATLSAAVYRDTAFTFHQPDGSPLPVHLWGDELSVRIEDASGWTLLQDATSWWCYALPDGNGGIAPSQVHAGAAPPPGLAKHLHASPAQRQAQRTANRNALGLDEQGRPDGVVVRAMHARQQAARARAMGLAVSPAPPSTTTTGTRHGLTFMVKFSDHLADATITQAQVDDFCNAIGYTDFGNNGSVHEYYTGASLGRLDYTNTVLDYVQATNIRDYYADTATPFGIRARELVMQMLDSLTTGQLAAGDADGDKVLDAVNIFYAGDCPNSWGAGLWPHMSTISWSGNGYTARSYQITNMGASLTIGTFCHENGHMLCGFPDLYDYDYDSTGSAGDFSLMDSGNYGGTPAGTNPVFVDGYLALAAGWRDAVDLDSTSTGTRTANVPSPADRTIYRYRNPGVDTEYFLFENRYNGGAATNRDAAIPGSGLAIWHVDEQGNRDDQRHAKNSQHHNYELALVQADNLFDFEDGGGTDLGDANDLWYLGNSAPLYTGVFWDGATASALNNARWWDGTLSGVLVGDISAAGTSMTFTIGARTIGLTATAISVSEGNSGTRYVNIGVTRTGTAPVSVDWATADGSATTGGLDYVGGSGTLSWRLGDLSDKTIRIAIRGDTTPEPDEDFTVTLSDPVGAALTASTVATITITNDDTAPPQGSLQFVDTLHTVSVTEGNGAAATPVSLTVQRVGGSSDAVSVHWSTKSGTAKAGTDFATGSGTLSWADGDAGDKTIALTVVGDDEPEADEAFTVVLDSPTGGAIAPTPNTTTVTIENDDAGIAFTTASQMVEEPSTGSVATYFIVHRTGAPHGSVHADYASADGTAIAPGDYIAVTGTVTFADGISDGVIGVFVAADAIPDNRRDFTLALSNPGSGAGLNAALGANAVLTATITDPALLAGTISSGSATNGGIAGRCGAGALALLTGAALLALRLRRR